MQLCFEIQISTKLRLDCLRNPKCRNAHIVIIQGTWIK